MATKSQKSKKAQSASTKGKARKKREPDDLEEVQDSASVETEEAGQMGDRIEKGVQNRLLRIENKLEKRKRGSRKVAVENDVEPPDDRDDVGELGEDEDFDINLKRIRRRRAARAARLRGIAPEESADEDSIEEVEDIEDDDIFGDGAAEGLMDRIFSFLPGSRSREYDRLIDRLEHMDEFGKNPELDPRLEAFMTFLYEKYWRVNTSGLENIPDEGRTLIVSNHSGVLPFDGAMMGMAIYKFHPAERYARFLIEDWFGQLPFATEFMNAVGQVRACQENAERLLRQEQLVGVFPEGIKGMAKGFKDRYNLARFGRGGVIRLAIRTGSPIVPCAVVGAEEIYIVLGYANWLGKMFGMPLLPITATFPWLGPLGLVPMPTKWNIQFGEIIRYDEYDESALKDNVIINRLNRQLRATIQEMLDSMLKKRRSLFF